MADLNKFGSAKHSQFGDEQHCAKCEAMLVDALDGTLSDADQIAFDLHMVDCPSCAGMYADARRGADWMEMLKSPRPEPPVALLQRILDQTSNRASETKQVIALGGNDFLRTPPLPNTLLGHPGFASSPVAAGPYIPAKVLPFRSRVTAGLRSIGHTMLQPRFAMTAAMAFFSIALPLNLTGVRLSSLRASDFKPSSILRNCYETKARVARYSDNLQFVYQLESRVHDLQHSDDNGLSSSPAPSPAARLDKKDDNPQPNGQKPGQKQPHPGPGSSRREGPAGTPHFVHSPDEPSRPADVLKAFVVSLPSISARRQEGGLV